MARLLFIDGTSVDRSQLVFNRMGPHSTHVYHDRSDDTVIWKIPILRDNPSSERQNRDNIALIQRLKITYRHLDGMPGLAQILAITDFGILMTLYPYGNLWQYINDDYYDMSIAHRIDLVPIIFDIVKRCHRLRVIIGDLHVKHFVLTEDEDWRIDLRMVLSLKSRLISGRENFFDIGDPVISVHHDLLRLAGIIDAVISGSNESYFLCDGEHDWPAFHWGSTDFYPLQFECWSRSFDNIDQMEVRVREMLQQLAGRHGYHFNWRHF